jgi:hypothetical protein
MKTKTLSLMLFAGTALAALPAQAAGDLNLICSADVVICEQMKGDFEKAHSDIKVNMVRLSSGETYAKVRAEAPQPEDRHLVGRHRRSASPGRLGKPDPGIQVAEARRTQRLGRRNRPKARATRRSASMPVRSAGATTPRSSRRRVSRSRSAGPISWHPS